MSHHARFASALLALAAGAMLAGPAHAADNTRYVSITGSNANPCTLAQPCKTLQRGINVTPAGGELRILDSGDYGANGNIKKSLTISGNGNTIFVANGIVINKADAVVALRGLVLDGQGTIENGIRIEVAAAVHIERYTIHDFTGNGIPLATPVVGLQVFVLDSISRDNGGSGLGAALAGGQALATIDNSRFENNGGNGIAFGNGRITIRRSTASGNGGQGILVVVGEAMIMSTIAAHNGQTGFNANANGRMVIESSAASGNGTHGLNVFTSGSARISNSTFSRNATGINNGGAVETRENNTVTDNTTNLSGNALTPLDGI